MQPSIMSRKCYTSSVASSGENCPSSLRVSVLGLLSPPSFLPELLYHVAPVLHLWQLGINRDIIPGCSCGNGRFSIPPLRLIRLLQSWRNRLTKPTTA